MVDASSDVGEGMMTDMLISSPSNADLTKNPRIIFYKKSGKAIDQERRWRSELEGILSRTKRNIRFDSNRSYDEHCKEDASISQPSIPQSEKFTCDSWRSHSNNLMLAEWQLFRPPNFADQYMMKLSPKGRHVLVKAVKGRTNIISRTGHIILRTKSRLPGGGLAQSDHHNASYSTLLDCIMLRPDRSNSVESGDKSSSLIRFAVLDLIQFRNTSYTRLSLDGVLFYHEAVPYRTGPTPLAGWLKPFMLTEWLPGVQIHPDYCTEIPPDYNDYKNEIKQQEDEKRHVLLMSSE